ncbi:hypothetical protein PENPOL_c021G06022 [Penicillium polonicum]|uniref:FAD/NAD(P)-binding domain-containing protein n=1 Tax=Penicillium polonicum TaxID=60169 RepID=A0A1V6N8C1_PENPO|nr:hypothetical protein PENPOL_c021G06022 [Penicillium polonicum]
MEPEVSQRSLEAPKSALNPLRDAKNWVPLLQEPAYKPRRIRIVCVGAGYSSLMTAYEVKYNKALGDFIDLTIYDKNEDVGGTWLENRYPGVACDIPAHIYTFPFEPNPEWSTFYASGPEIFQATWDEPSSKWRLKIRQDGEEKEDECNILIDGSGFLNNWNWPGIEGLHDFKGELEPSIDVAGKKVAVIGNGSSAIQVFPQLQKTAAQLTNYIRSPTWIFSNHAADLTKDGRNFAFTEEEKKGFCDNPASLFKLRREIERSADNFFKIFFKDSAAQKAALAQAHASMRERLGNDQELCDKLIPRYELGCRRATPGDGYLEALREKNARVNVNPIVQITESGIQTTHEHTEFDIIVCATGFDVSYRPSWTIQGRNGHQLNLAWSDSPEAYFGIAAANTPNYFIFNGPNSPVGHGSLLDNIFCVTKWILKWCRKMATEDIKSICVKQEALDDYNT